MTAQYENKKFVKRIQLSIFDKKSESILFQAKMRINFYDCDPAGIMFFANIFKFAHTAYELFLNNISPERNFFFDDELVLPIIHSEADYKKPLKAFQEIDCRVEVNELRNSSFELHYTFLVDGKIYATASTVHVCVAKETFEKCNLPGSLKDALRNEIK